MKRIALAAAALGALGNEFDSLDAIDKAAVKNEKAALESTLYRCRALVGRIGEELRKKKPEHFVDERSLADFHASLEHAAWVLEQQIRPSVENASDPVVKGSQVRAH